MIGIIGTNHKQANLEKRERIAKAFSSIDALFSIASQSVLLETCNRIEWYFFHKRSALLQKKILAHLRNYLQPEDLYALYTFFGEECEKHLVNVTSGMDSFFLGETEIQAQVKKAYLSACFHKTVGKELHQLFQKSLHKSKEIRTKIIPKQQQTLSEKVVEIIYETIQDKTVLFVGASMINKTIAHLLKESTKLYITNRSPENLYSFSQEYGAEPLPWEQLPSFWGSFSCVITATRSSGYIIKDSPDITESPQLLIDLSVPRNIDQNLKKKRPFFFDLEQVFATP